MRLTEENKAYLKGYAQALQTMLFLLTGENGCAKRYDPIDFEDLANGDQIMWSYAFDLKEGGRTHPVVNYESVDEIADVMVKEVMEMCNEYNKTKLISILDDILKHSEERICGAYRFNGVHEAHIASAFEKVGIKLEPPF